MANLSPIGWRCSRRSCLSRVDRALGLSRGRCCSITCRFGSGRWIGAVGRFQAAGSRSTCSARSVTGLGRRSSDARRHCRPRIPPNWSAFLGSLPGEPERIVCDAHTGMLQAIEQRWPRAELHRCEWHLQHALERLLAKELRRDPSEELQELRNRVQGALVGPSFWGQFVRVARTAENESVDRWIAANGSCDRGAVRSPATGITPPRRHAPHHSRLRADHAADHHGASPASLRALEPGATQPAADAAPASTSTVRTTSRPMPKRSASSWRQTPGARCTHDARSPTQPAHPHCAEFLNPIGCERGRQARARARASTSRLVRCRP